MLSLSFDLFSRSEGLLKEYATALFQGTLLNFYSDDDDVR